MRTPYSQPAMTGSPWALSRKELKKSGTHVPKSTSLAQSVAAVPMEMGMVKDSVSMA